MKHHLPVAVTAIAATLLSTSCTSNPSTDTADSSPSSIAVNSSDTECNLKADTAPSGNVVFDVKNTGNQVTEFYLLGEDGLRILGEVENIGPGLSRQLVVRAAPGQYHTACKPGMKGDGIRHAFTVTDSGVDLAPAGEEKALVDTANQQYQAYVKDQTDQLLEKTQKFAQAYIAGKEAEARALYPDARVHWERIETVAESFGDLDPRMDLREADLEPGQAWTGWHTMEKDLWPPQGHTKYNATRRAELANQLVADTKELHQRTRTLTFTVDQIGNGAKGLLDEVATGKVTGEEEIFSHTDLWDFRANVDGAKVAWQGLRPLLKKRKPQLDQLIEKRFNELDALLNRYRKGDGFMLYTELTKPQVKELSDAVNALSEPLSTMTGAVV